MHLSLKQSIFLGLLLALIFAIGSAIAAEPKQVMPAKRRAQIVATAKALFDPEIKKSLKVGKVSSPFSAVGGN